jgi:hypothetical protein
MADFTLTSASPSPVYVGGGQIITVTGTGFTEYSYNLWMCNVNSAGVVSLASMIAVMYRVNDTTLSGTGMNANANYSQQNRLYLYRAAQSSGLIEATFTRTVPLLTITASAGSNGAISPSGEVTARVASNTTFTATPNQYYEIDDWTVDGVAAGSTASTRDINNIQANRTIAVSFKRIIKTATVSAGDNGTVSPSGAVSVDMGTDKEFTATPAEGYKVYKWTVDDAVVQYGGTTYTLEDVITNHTVAVSFIQDNTIGEIIADVGPISGGTHISIHGAGFTTATAVNFVHDTNTLVADDFVLVSDSVITCTTPMVPYKGKYNVVVVKP